MSASEPSQWQPGPFFRWLLHNIGWPHDSLQSFGALVLAREAKKAVALANQLAPEQLQLEKETLR